MHYVAGVLLIIQFALMLIVEESVHVRGLDWLAWAVWLVAVLLLTLSMLTLRRRGGVLKGRSYVETSVVVDEGIYGLVRHPQYLGWLLMHAVVPLFKPDALLALLGIAGIACVVGFTLQEEARLLDRFGNSYRNYMRSVPRYNLLGGGARRILAKGNEEKPAGA
jgi:protein-S-isoprenylcysteine O-methyltransferase Ste14